MSTPLTCADCGHPMKRVPKSLPQGHARCHPCRRIRPVKMCTQCGQARPIDEFWSDKRQSSGRRPNCAECARKRASKPLWGRQQARANCATCGGPKPVGHGSKYCSPECRPSRKHAIERRRANRTPCVDCGSPSFGERCQTCHNLTQGWVPGRTKSEKRRQASLRRTARERLAPGLTRDERYALRDKWIRQGRTCYYCPTKADTLDHVVPLARGGTNYEGNLVPCCNDCNWKKNDNLLIRWRTGIGAKMWHLRIDAPKVDPRSRPKRKRKVVQMVIELRPCRWCGAEFIPKTSRSALCSDECKAEEWRTYMRNRYRKGVGIPEAAPLYSRAG